MTNRLALAIFIAAVLFAGCAVTAANAKDVKVNEETLSHLEFSSPEKRGEKEYLGLANKKTFSLPDIKAGILIIEIFSMYCPICQAEAPRVNEMHALIEKDPKLRRKVKLLGIGTGNTPFEVNVFRDKFNVRFPLLPDDNFLMQKALSERIRTPTFIVVRLKAKKKPQVLKVHVGRMESADSLLIDLR